MAHRKFPNLRSYEREENGASMVEFALIVTLLALIAFPSMQAVGPALSTSIQCTGDSVAGSSVGPGGGDCLTAKPQSTPTCDPRSGEC